MVTADHGNADQMQDQSGETRTAHSTNLVPFVVYNSQQEIKLKESNSDESDVYASTSLANIAPTILEYLDLEQPKEMLASSLLEKALVG